MPILQLVDAKWASRFSGERAAMFEGLDPNIVAIGLFAVGYFLASKDRGSDQHAKSIKVDTELLSRLRTVEEWQRDHNSLHGCVRELAATTQSMAKNVDRLTRRVDAWLSAAAMASPGNNRNIRPYDFPGAREWVDADLGTE